MKTTLEKFTEALEEMGLDYGFDDFDELYPELITVCLDEETDNSENNKGFVFFHFDKETGKFLNYCTNIS